MKRNKEMDEKLYKLFMDTYNIDGIIRDIRVDILTEKELKYFAQIAAIGMAHDLYRNGVIEEFHADSCKEANIPDSVMKVINKDVCNNCYDFIMKGLSNDLFIPTPFIFSYLTGTLYGSSWDAPTLVPKQLERMRASIHGKISYDRVGIEMFVTHINTQKRFLMFFVFTTSDCNTVIPSEIEEGPLDNEKEYDFNEFIRIMAENYEIESYSYEHMSDLLGESDELDENFEDE